MISRAFPALLALLLCPAPISAQPPGTQPAPATQPAGPAPTPATPEVVPGVVSPHEAEDVAELAGRGTIVDDTHLDPGQWQGEILGGDFSGEFTAERRH